MTEQEQEQLISELKTFLHANNTTKREKPPKKGLFSKVVVLLCLLSGLGVCAAYFGFCWMSGQSPSEAIVAAMLAYTYGELWHCRKIKESKNKDGDK